MSFLDIEDEDDAAPALPVVVADAPKLPAAVGDRLRVYEDAISKLTDKQKNYLKVWTELNYNQRRACAQIGIDPSTVYRWGINDENYILAVRTMREEISKEILNKERLVLVQEELVQDLMTPKPVFQQGIPLLYEGEVYKEMNAAAAAKIVETQLKVGGHMKDDEGKNRVVVNIVRLTGEYEPE